MRLADTANRYCVYVCACACTYARALAEILFRDFFFIRYNNFILYENNLRAPGAKKKVVRTELISEKAYIYIGKLAENLSPSLFSVRSRDLVSRRAPSRPFDINTRARARN